MHPAKLRIDQFTYPLPDERIARYPLEKRSDSKLLIFREHQIEDSHVRDLAKAVPDNAVFIFNNTKVVEARLFFPKADSAPVEVFCLNPEESMGDITQAMMRYDEVHWVCLLGGAKKWRDGETRSITFDIEGHSYALKATRIKPYQEAFLMHFSWDKPETPFVDMLHTVGQIPLPPYLHRDAEEEDKVRYQTVYAQREGSVAAPTAGLHFTPEILEQLDQHGCRRIELTLHVGAGTFRPVKSETMEEHTMHAEHIDVSEDTLLALIEVADRPWIPVGTTAMRTLETLYQMGLKATLNPNYSIKELAITQWEAYEREANISRTDALTALLHVLRSENQNRLMTETQIMIAPSFPLRMADALQTNFHQPQSTLLLLIAALVGDEWKRIYEHALNGDYRFLSYGDSSLLWLHTKN